MSRQLQIPQYTAGTVAVTGSSGNWTLAGTGTVWTSPDGVSQWTIAVGDIVVIPSANAFGLVGAINSNLSISLAYWSGSTVSAGASYAINRLTGLPSAAAAGLVQALLALGSTTNPFAALSALVGSGKVNFSTDGSNNIILQVRTAAGYTDSNYVTAFTINPLTGAVTLSSSLSAANVSFTAAGTGAVARTVAARLGDVVNIKDFGGVGDGATDNTAALNAALAVLSGTGGKITFPAGKFKFASAIAFTFPVGSPIFAVALEGAGTGATILTWPNTNGLAFTLSSAQHMAHVRDLSITTGTAGSYTGLTLTNATAQTTLGLLDVSRCIFRGDDGAAQTDYWANAISVNGVSGVNFVDSNFYGASAGTAGIGVNLSGYVSGTKYSVNSTVVGCNFYYLGTGVEYGAYVQSVEIDDCNFSNGAVGIASAASETGTLAQLSVVNSEFNTTSHAVLLSTDVDYVSFSDNLVNVNTSSDGLNIPGNEGVVIVGNTFTFSGTVNTGTGVILGTTASNFASLISGNSFYGLALGISLLSGCAGAKVEGNSYGNCTASVSDAGTNNLVLDQAFQCVVLNATNTLTSQTAAQPIFDGPTPNGAVTLGVGTYEFECIVNLSGMSATSGAFGFALGGSATITQSWIATANKVATIAAASATAYVSYNTAANTALVANDTSTSGYLWIKGTIRVIAAGTVVPQISLGVAAAAVIAAGSYFKVAGLSYSAAMTNVGNWS